MSVFVDKTDIVIKAGKGGNGAVSFRREKYVSHGGPDGGYGGCGGNIVLKIEEGSNTLLFYKNHRKFIAQNGDNGAGAKMLEIKEGLGLYGMKQRAESYGGEVSFSSEIDEGFELLLRLPHHPIKEDSNERE
jgi:hypothetical protein